MKTPLLIYLCHFLMCIFFLPPRQRNYYLISARWSFHKAFCHSFHALLLSIRYKSDHSLHRLIHFHFICSFQNHYLFIFMFLIQLPRPFVLFHDHLYWSFNGTRSTAYHKIQRFLSFKSKTLHVANLKSHTSQPSWSHLRYFSEHLLFTDSFMFNKIFIFSTT